MKRVIVYVEGPSDRLAMEELLADLLARLQAAGVAVAFMPALSKNRLMIQTPVKAANVLCHDPHTVVIALPDLYPPNVAFGHTTYEELRQALRHQFERALARKRLDDVRVLERFRVFCHTAGDAVGKYDLDQAGRGSESRQSPQAYRRTAFHSTWRKVSGYRRCSLDSRSLPLP